MYIYVAVYDERNTNPDAATDKVVFYVPEWQHLQEEYAHVLIGDDDSPLCQSVQGIEHDSNEMTMFSTLVDSLSPYALDGAKLSMYKLMDDYEFATPIPQAVLIGKHEFGNRGIEPADGDRAEYDDDDDRLADNPFTR